MTNFPCIPIAAVLSSVSATTAINQRRATLFRKSSSQSIWSTPAAVAEVQPIARIIGEDTRSFLKRSFKG